MNRIYRIIGIVCIGCMLSCGGKQAPLPSEQPLPPQAGPASDQDQASAASTNQNTLLEDAEQNLLLTVLCLLSIGGLYFLFIKNKRLQEEVGSLERRLWILEKNSLSKTVAGKTNNVPSPTVEKGFVLSDIDRNHILDNLMELLKKERPNWFCEEEPESEKPAQPEVVTVVEEAKPLEPSSRFCKEASQENRCFYDADFTSQFVATQSIFEFDVHKDGNTASFKVVQDGDTVIRTKNYYEDLLLTACENDYGLPDHPKRIITIEDGMVERSGDKWLITRKAKIRYES